MGWLDDFHELAGEDGRSFILDRIRRIFFWLLHSSLVTEYPGRNMFFLSAGQYVRLRNSREEEVLSWLDREGFNSIFSIEGYLIKQGRDEKDRQGLWIIKVVEVPFEDKSQDGAHGMDECPF